MKFFDRVRVNTPTTGNGDTIVLGAAVSTAFLTLAEAGAVENDESVIVAEELEDFAIYKVTVGSGATSVDIDEVVISKIGGTVGTSKMNLAGNATVRFIESADEINRFGYITVSDSAPTSPQDGHVWRTLTTKRKYTYFAEIPGWIEDGAGGVGTPLPLSLIGVAFPWPFNFEPSFGCFINGQELNRADHPTLWGMVQAGGSLSPSEGAKFDGQFGPGDGSTTFTVPDAETAQRIIRPWNGGGIGAEEEDGAPNITGNVNFRPYNAGAGGIAFSPSGAFSTTDPSSGSTSGFAAESTSFGTTSHSFDASDSNAKYGAASEIRMKSFHWPYILIHGGVGA